MLILLRGCLPAPPLHILVFLFCSQLFRTQPLQNNRKIKRNHSEIYTYIIFIFLHHASIQTCFIQYTHILILCLYIYVDNIFRKWQLNTISFVIFRDLVWLVCSWSHLLFQNLELLVPCELINASFLFSSIKDTCDLVDCRIC